MTRRPSEGFGRRLAKYRKLAGISAQALSDRLGGELSRGVIANIESGRKQDVTIDQLVMLSAALGVSPIALALPIDEPDTLVRVIGLNDGAHTQHAVSARRLIGWFSNRIAYQSPVPQFEGIATLVARDSVDAVNEYYWAQSHYWRTKQSVDAEAIAEAEREMITARERAEALGVTFGDPDESDDNN